MKQVFFAIYSLMKHLNSVCECAYHTGLLHKDGGSSTYTAATTMSATIRLLRKLTKNLDLETGIVVQGKVGALNETLQLFDHRCPVNYMGDKNAVQTQTRYIGTNHGSSHIREECSERSPKYDPKYELCSNLQSTDAVYQFLRMLD